MTDIILFGTFHFLESPLDIFNEKVQRDLSALVNRLQAFEPDAVAVEAAVHAQEEINASYSRFCLEDLKHREIMQQKTLGSITLAGCTYPITYQNEAVQIGYRLARLSGLPMVHTIDDDTPLNMDAVQEPLPPLKSAIDALQADVLSHSADSLPDLLRYYQGNRYSALNHSVYIQANAVNTAAESYAGADFTAAWYQRNLRIFSNIQRLAAHYKRIFILIGAGHLHLLRDLIHADEHLQLIDLKD